MTGMSKGRCNANKIHGMRQWVEGCLEKVVIQMNSNFHFSEEEETKHVRIRILSDVSGMSDGTSGEEIKNERTY